MSATHPLIPLFAALAALSSLALASLAAGFWLTFDQRGRNFVLWRFKAFDVHADEFFGMAGILGCAFAALSHVIVYLVVAL